MKTEKATFGAGCFWGVEARFRELEGVIDAPVGYMGGETENPTYKQVCAGDTGHVEVCEVEYDPAKISFVQLLDAFFEMHDPTQGNRQGPDIGWQYRSVIFYTTSEQKELAEQYLAKLVDSNKYADAITTTIEPAQPFYRAEEYHQRYFEKTGRQVCH